MTNDDADRIAKQVAEWQGIVAGTETESLRDAWTEMYESQDFEVCNVIAAELMRRGDDTFRQMDPAEERARIAAEIADYEGSDPFTDEELAAAVAATEARATTEL